MAKNVFGEDAYSTYEYPVVQPTGPDPCASLRKQLNKQRRPWMVGQDKYRNFLVDVGANIIALAPSKGVTMYGALYVISQSAYETAFGTNAGAKKYNNYWGHRVNGRVDSDYSTLTFSQSFDKYLDLFNRSWPDMLALLKSRSQIIVDPLNDPTAFDYYFTSEEVNQALNSGKYGGNGSGNGPYKTPKIITGTCYNAEFYSLNVDYARKIFSVLTKFIFTIYSTITAELLQLSSQNPPCEPDVPSLTDGKMRLVASLIEFNMKWISGKDYGYYMPITLPRADPPKNPIIDANGNSVLRPKTNISDRLIVNNSKGVTIPQPID